MRGALAAHMNIGKRVDRIPDFGQFGEDCTRVLSLEQGAIVAPPDSIDDHVEFGIDPDRYGLFEDDRAGFGIHERASAGCNHLRLPVDEACNHAPLAIAEMAFAEAFEDFGDRKPGGSLDFVIGVDERDLEAQRQPAPDGRLANPHQADKDDGASAFPSRQICFTVHRARGYTQGLSFGQSGGSVKGYLKSS